MHLVIISSISSIMKIATSLVSSATTEGILEISCLGFQKELTSLRKTLAMIYSTLFDVENMNGSKAGNPFPVS